MVETTDEDAPPAPFNPMEFDAGSEVTRAATAAAGAMLLETIDDDDGAPAPFNSVEFESDNEEKMTATAAAGAMMLETIDDDDAAPAPFNSLEFDTDNEEKRTATAAAGAMLLETTDDDDAAPAPFNSTEFEEHRADPSNPNAMQRTNTSDEDSNNPAPVREDIRDQSAQFRMGLASNRVPLFPAGRVGMDRIDGRNRDIDIHTRPRNAVESRTHPIDNNSHVAGEEKEEVSVPDIVLEADVERDVAIHIPEATLVVERDEEVVYIATPVDPATPPEPSVPWWKHQRTKFGEIIIVLAALSITIYQLMKDEPVPSSPSPLELYATTSPSISMAPSSLSPLELYTTTSPSIGMAPSSLSPLELFTTTFPTSPALPSATSAPTSAPTYNLSPGARTAQIRELMSTISDPVLFDDPTTPQARALEWITNEDAIVPTLFPNIGRLGCTKDGLNPMVQRYVLATFYFATNGDDWNQCSAPENFDDAASVATANDNCARVVTPFNVGGDRVVGTDAWLGPVNECYWGGVACWGASTPENYLCLDQLDFQKNGLSGKLVPELSVLLSMRFLILQEGTISGPIPSEYGKLVGLLILDMDYNEISGTLPETLYDLSAMQHLDLNDNQLTGTISTRIGELSALTFVQIDHNSFSSTIPSEMGQLSSLSIAFLHVNGFTGAMPEDVCALRNNTSPPGLLGIMITDCLGNPPEVDCPCCSSCV